ncbi:hypothetical protein LAZ67_16002963 [Cordylochernes scorpioides]|uniref:Peptidase aspartic putative domain-containing protein n=1 Tax=Cordylochernes scorpioides TaxID=51811 RepID=A0ABY6LF52_9ARAC|nr:hypothetical protein LAZ67_16002963 [Cordylochernes scorpioides]
MKGLILADPLYFKSREIDVILGSDIVFNLIQEGRRNGNENEPSAIHSKLGWLVYGPTSATPSYGRVSHPYPRCRLRASVTSMVRLPSSVVYLYFLELPPRPASCGNPITHPLPRLPSTFHLGITTEPVKVDRMTEDKQRMTEVEDEHVADALTNMQPHCEDLVSRLNDAIRGLAVPRADEAIISSFDGSHTTSSLLPYSHLQRSTPASIHHFKVL